MKTEPIDFESIPIMLTVEELQKILRVSRNTAYEYVRRGIIPSVRIGKQIRIYRGDVFALRQRGSDIDNMELTPCTLLASGVYFA